MNPGHAWKPVSYISWMPLLTALVNTFVFHSLVRLSYSLLESSQGQSCHMSLLPPELFSQERRENHNWGHYLCVFPLPFNSHKLKKMSAWHDFQQGAKNRHGWRSTGLRLSAEMVCALLCLLTSNSDFFGTNELLELIHIAPLFCLS